MKSSLKPYPMSKNRQSLRDANMSVQFICTQIITSIKCQIRIVFCPISIVPSHRFTFNFAAEKQMSYEPDRNENTIGRTTAEIRRGTAVLGRPRATIREMIDIEFDRRGMKTEGNPHPENPPPESRGREPPDRKPPRRTFWQRLMNLFTSGLL